MPKKLDIIVTRYDEPWKIGKRFFDMIGCQQCVSPDEFEVTLVQADRADALTEETWIRSYSFPIRIVTVGKDAVGKDATLAEMRNAGISHTSAEWIMFCDIDDMFADVCSLRMILNIFPVQDYDIIWGKNAREDRWCGKTTYINRVEEGDFANVIAKFYRRKFLEEKNIWFDVSVPLFTDYMFNTLCLAETVPFRIVELTTDFYIYFKTFREDSFHVANCDAEVLAEARMRREMRSAKVLKKRGLKFPYLKAVAGAICTEYYRIYDPEKQEGPADFSDEFLEFCLENYPELDGLSGAEMEVVRDAAESETMAIIQKIYNYHGKEYYFANDTVSFHEWIERLEGKVAEYEARLNAKPEEALEATVEPEEPQEEPDVRLARKDPVVEAHEPRVAVYCGTYNTYQSMVASAKSLLYNTKMDKVYFLIEDDRFPFAVPDIVECINVKDQTWFPEDGPNYNNAWSYMCMMRAAFTKLIPYDKVLSLDIDVIIQEDIGCLWDIDMENYYLAGVTEPQRQKSISDPPYINFGVVMMNLRKIREDGIDDQVITSLNTTKHGCPEQDAFNKACAWHIYQLKNDYNATIHSHITGECEKERIIHYAGIRFWRHFGHVKEYANKPWEIIMQEQAKKEW